MAPKNIYKHKDGTYRAPNGKSYKTKASAEKWGGVQASVAAGGDAEAMRGESMKNAVKIAKASAKADRSAIRDIKSGDDPYGEDTGIKGVKMTPQLKKRAAEAERAAKMLAAKKRKSKKAKK